MWVCTYIFVVECMCVCAVHMQVWSILSVVSQVPLCLDQLNTWQFGFTGWPANPRNPHVSTILGLRLQVHTTIRAFKNEKVCSENPIQVLMLIPQAFYWGSHFPSPYLAFDCKHFSRTVILAGLVEELKWIPTTFSVLGISVENFKSLGWGHCPQSPTAGGRAATFHLELLLLGK